MGELGTDSATAHDEIGRLVVRLNIGRLVVVGSEGSPAAPIHYGATQEGSWGDESILVPDAEAAVALLHDQLRPEDVVLVKASKVAQLWRVADALLASDSVPAPAPRRGLIPSSSDSSNGGDA
jgi:UDP-N-acetylmuramoyl-tripeptide--D-alanyl-D-alanine ligase